MTFLTHEQRELCEK